MLCYFVLPTPLVARRQLTLRAQVRIQLQPAHRAEDVLLATRAAPPAALRCRTPTQGLAHLARAATRAPDLRALHRPPGHGDPLRGAPRLRGGAQRAQLPAAHEAIRAGTSQGGREGRAARRRSQLVQAVGGAIPARRRRPRIRVVLCTPEQRSPSVAIMF